MDINMFKNGHFINYFIIIFSLKYKIIAKKK